MWVVLVKIQQNLRDSAPLNNWGQVGKIMTDELF